MSSVESPVSLQDNEKNAADPSAGLEPRGTQSIDKFLVKLEPLELATAYSRPQKWWTLIVVCSSALCVTCASSMVSCTTSASYNTIQPPCWFQATSTLPHIEKEFHVGTEVAILSISLFIMGLGIGPLIAGGMSEFVGRNIIYRLSFIAFFILNFPVAFANNIGQFIIHLPEVMPGINITSNFAAVHLTFRFISGFGGAAFLSLGGGSIADLFMGPKVAT
jgi:MFS family permease